MIAVITGGTGGAKFVQGLAQVTPPAEISVIVNTGDDLRWWGLHVSPDLDSITYALAGVLSRERGWGYEGDTFTCLERMRQLGAPGWFQLGDRDLATHLRRTELLAQGRTLSEATAEIGRAMGVAARIFPMSNDRVETRVLTDVGDLGFQEYFVRERHRPAPQAVRFEGAQAAFPAPGVLQTIRDAEAVLIAPSNPITSIGPILSIPGIRDALRQAPAPVVAISPIVARAAVSGPAGALMRMQGIEVSATGVAHAYRDFLDCLVADERDATEAEPIEGLDIAARFTRTVMDSDFAKTDLARFALRTVSEAARSRARKAAG